jgi:ADP-ribosylation factor-like protein 3
MDLGRGLCRRAAIKGELRRIGSDPRGVKKANVPVLIFATKRDLMTALPVDQVTAALDLHTIHDYEWQIQGCSALKGAGLDDGLTWLVQAIK